MLIIKNNAYASENPTFTAILSGRQTGKTASFKRKIAEMMNRSKPFKKKKLKK